MEGLNAYLQEVGCKDTHYSNPHGLTHPDHYTTAWDMALLTQRALKNPTFRQIVSSVKYVCPKNNKRDELTLLNTNRLLRKGPHYYSKAIGVKTGYTAAAQHNIVAAAEHEGRTLIVVLMHCKERNDLWTETIQLFQTAFAQPLIERVLLPAGPQPYRRQVKGAGRELKTVLVEPLVWRYYPAEEEPIGAELVWKDLSLPIAKGQVVAEVRVITPNGRLVASTDLSAAHEVKLSPVIAAWNWFQQNPALIGVLEAMLLAYLAMRRGKMRG